MFVGIRQCGNLILMKCKYLAQKLIWRITTGISHWIYRTIALLKTPTNNWLRINILNYKESSKRIQVPILHQSTNYIIYKHIIFHISLFIITFTAFFYKLNHIFVEWDNPKYLNLNVKKWFGEKWENAPYKNLRV